MVEYRGYGKSTGTPSEKELQSDAQVVLDYLANRRDIDPNRIIVFGLSLGGAVACNLVSNNPDRVKAVILENTFTSIEDMIEVVFPLVSRFKFLSRK